MRLHQEKEKIIKDLCSAICWNITFFSQVGVKTLSKSALTATCWAMRAIDVTIAIVGH